MGGIRKPAGGVWLVPTLVPSRWSALTHFAQDFKDNDFTVLSDFTSSVLSPQIHF